MIQARASQALSGDQRGARLLGRTPFDYCSASRSVKGRLDRQRKSRRTRSCGTQGWHNTDRHGGGGLRSADQAGVDAKQLTSHFQKLFAYDHCLVFFHLTYAYIKDVEEVIEYLKEMAEKAAPPAFKYKNREDIKRSDSRPSGFVAEYEPPHAPVKVVFLVLDMQQEARREAAKLTAATKSG
ncbi:hypothetical protein [Bradyrhizobium sp. Ec3.3]|uniref:hypothetical protein n=1 Tax=Bradyrhizobium sp. Ec3.3 TaxID=189753 RepID=UPI0012EB8E4C|nr:hypothetical protein [Bradyrhizobium sp. Ec3.3]